MNSSHGFQTRRLAIGDPAPAALALRDEATVMSSWTGDSDIPRVSILCATYNHVAFIEDALRGFFGQVTQFPFEILVRDDASTDGTTQILSAYAARYPRILRVLFESENTFTKGVSPGRVLRAQARAPHVAFCEGDDWWICPDKLQRQMDAVDRHAVNHVFHPVYVVNQDRVHSYQGNKFPGRVPARLLRVRNAFSPLLSRLYRTTEGDLLALPHTRGMDAVVSAALACSSDAYNIPDYYAAVYRQHPSGIWSGLDRRGRKRHRLRTQAAIVHLLMERGFELDAVRVALKMIWTYATGVGDGLRRRWPWKLRRE